VRTPTNNPVGTAAQSAVKAQFELLGWGVAPNPEHDLGTDHWVMARDDERVDIRRLVGVQVKAGETPFKRRVTVDGIVTGWWFYERDDRHFEYWSSHSIPHILALHEIKDGTTYWVHVTADKIQSTGKGCKIFVPASQKVDAENRGALMEVALSNSTLPEFQGSAWEEGEDVPAESALRYALMTPRLLAPHGNRTPTAISPAQAIALLVQMRVTTLERWQKIEPLLDHNKAGESTTGGGASTRRCGTRCSRPTSTRSERSMQRLQTRQAGRQPSQRWLPFDSKTRPCHARSPSLKLSISRTLVPWIGLGWKPTARASS